MTKYIFWCRHAVERVANSYLEAEIRMKYVGLSPVVCGEPIACMYRYVLKYCSW